MIQDSPLFTMRLPETSLPFTILLNNSAEDNLVYCEQLLRNLPEKRLVYQGLWQERPVLVKLFLSPERARRHWAREKSGIDALQDTPVSTPKLLFAGDLDDNTPVLIFSFLSAAKTFLDVWNNLTTLESRTILLGQLVEQVSGLHQAGLIQKDLHLENFLISEQKIFAIDGDAISNQHAGSPLDLNASSRNLALLFAQLSPRYDSLMEGIVRDYAQQRQLSGLQLLARLKLDLPEVRRKRRLKYVKKSYRTCSEFVRLKRAGQVAISRRDVQGETLNRLLDDPDAFMSSGEVLKDGHTSTVVRVQTDACDWVIKRYNIKNPWHALSRYFRPTRAWTTWGNAHRLKISGIATPEAIAVIEKRIGPLRSTGYYISGFIAGIPSGHFFQNDTMTAATREQAARAFVLLFELFHKLCIHHGDCKASNFLLRNNEPWVLDLDAMREYSSPVRFQKLFQVDRQRFLRNWQTQPELQQWFDDHLPG